MNARTKRRIRVLLSSLLVRVMDFQSFAAPQSFGKPAAEPETAKVTGTWSRDAAGNWSFRSRE